MILAGDFSSLILLQNLKYLRELASSEAASCSSKRGIQLFIFSCSYSVVMINLFFSFVLPWLLLALFFFNYNFHFIQYIIITTLFNPTFVFEFIMSMGADLSLLFSTQPFLTQRFAIKF